MKNVRTNSKFMYLVALLLLTIISGCGGGGGSGGSGGAGDSTTKYTIGGTISGLASTNTGLVLQNNGGNNLTIAGGATSFTFSTAIASGGAYNVTVLSQPAQMSCSFSSSSTSGTVSNSNITNVSLSCVPKNELVSRSTDDTLIASAFDSVTPIVMSANGRYVAFRSSTALISGGVSYRQIYRRDRQTNQTVLVSRATGATGAIGNADSDRMSISGDGRYVLFESGADNLVTGDTNSSTDIFLRDLDLNTTTRVSVGDGGIQANYYSRESALSADGRYAAFYSEANNIISGVAAGNLYVRDLLTGTNTLVSVTPSGASASGRNPSISADGSRIAFYSYNSTLVADDTNGVWDIFVYDRNANPKVKRVSISTGGAQRNQGNESASRITEPTISGDGNYVAFSTTADSLVPGDLNGIQDVFIHQINTGETTRVSVSSTGIEANGDSPVGQGERVALSYTGEWIAFTSKATNLTSGALNTSVILHNRITGQTTAVTSTTGSIGDKGPAISSDGRFVTFVSSVHLDPRFDWSGVFVQDTLAP